MISAATAKALKEVEGYVHVEFRRRQYEAMNGERIGLYHVSDFANACQRNAYYQHIDRDPGYAFRDTTQNSILFAGEAIHQLLDKAAPDGEGETPLAWNLKTDSPVDITDKKALRNYTLDDWSGIIIGEADALYNKNTNVGPTIIVDYKTWVSKPGSFYKKALDPVHKEQINIYRYLFAKVHAKDYKYGAVVYLDFTDRFAKPIIHSFETDTMDNIEKRLQAKQALFAQALFTGKMPPRTINWKCNGYCPYAEHCFSNDDVDVADARSRIAI